MLNAYLDGELDLVTALETERRIAAEPKLAAERDRIQALRSVLRDLWPQETPSPALYARIEQAVGMPAARARPSWLALAASVALAAILAGATTWITMNWVRADGMTQAVVAAHVRALMAPQPFDVASADGHVVKPWFNGRIPQSPRVVDLSKAGFPLAGGRIDVIGRDPVATIIYKRRQHTISLIEIPAQSLKAVGHDKLDGYNVVTWIGRDDVGYLAVSDLNATELDEFVALVRSAP